MRRPCVNLHGQPTPRRIPAELVIRQTKPVCLSRPRSVYHGAGGLLPIVGWDAPGLPSRAPPMRPAPLPAVKRAPGHSHLFSLTGSGRPHALKHTTPRRLPSWRVYHVCERSIRADLACHGAASPPAGSSRPGRPGTRGVRADDRATAFLGPLFLLSCADRADTRQTSSSNRPTTNPPNPLIHPPRPEA
jgi:hypothetical protein